MAGWAVGLWPQRYEPERLDYRNGLGLFLTFALCRLVVPKVSRVMKTGAAGRVICRDRLCVSRFISINRGLAEDATMFKTAALEVRNLLDCERPCRTIPYVLP